MLKAQPRRGIQAGPNLIIVPLAGFLRQHVLERCLHDGVLFVLSCVPAKAL